jgi:hypothetical protein
MVEAALPCRDKCGKWTAHPVDHVWSSSHDVSRFLLRIRILRTASSAEVLQVLSSWNVVTRGTSAKDPAVRQDSLSDEHNAMDNLDCNTLVLSANDSQEPQARYREYTLQQDLLACNKQYGMDPTQIKDQSSMASLPDRRTTLINPNYGGVESPFDTSQGLEFSEADRDNLDCTNNFYCKFTEDRGAHEWVSGCPGLPSIAEELSSPPTLRPRGHQGPWHGHAPGRNGGNGGLPRLAGRPVACCYGEDIGTSKMLRDFTSLTPYHYRLPILFFLLCQTLRKQATLVMYSFTILSHSYVLRPVPRSGKPMPGRLRALHTHVGVNMGRVPS